MGQSLVFQLGEQVNMHIRSFILGVSFSGVFMLGCMVSRVMPEQTIPTAKATAGHQTWQYMCLNDPSAVTEAANKLGRQGWEMITGGGAGDMPHRKFVYCFKRPAQ